MASLEIMELNPALDTRNQTAELVVDRLEVRLDPHGAVVVEALARVAEQPNRLQEVVRHHRLVHVELEVAL